MDYKDDAFHVIARAARRGLLILDDADAKTLISLLRSAALRFPIRILCACLMLTHYHLLIRGSKAVLAEAMKFIDYMYTMYFNDRHGGSGHLLEAPYKAFPKPGWEMILACSRYISLNPLATVTTIDQLPGYPWSTLPAYMGRTYFDWLDLEILQRIDPDPVAAAAKYWDFVKAGEAGFHLASKGLRMLRDERRVRLERADERMQLAATYVYWLEEEIRTSLPGAPDALRGFKPEELALFAASQAGVGSVRLLSTLLGLPSSSGHRAVKTLAELQRASPRMSGFFDMITRAAFSGKLGHLCEA